MRRYAEGSRLIRCGEQLDSIFLVIFFLIETDSGFPPCRFPPVYTHLSLHKAGHTQFPQNLLVHQVLLLISQLIMCVILVRSGSSAVVYATRKQRAGVWGKREGEQIK